MSVSSHLNNVRTTTKIINSNCPNGQIIRSTMEGELYFPMLANIAIQAHILPNIKYFIVSIGSLRDAGCTVTLKIKYVTVVYKDDIILLGWRNHSNTF